MSQEEKESVMKHLSQAQKRFQSIKAQEKEKATVMKEMFSLAGNLKAVTGQSIDDRQAKILYNVAKTRKVKGWV
jgi:hypothetical protein